MEDQQQCRQFVHSLLQEKALLTPAVGLLLHFPVSTFSSAFHNCKGSLGGDHSVESCNPTTQVQVTRGGMGRGLRGHGLCQIVAHPVDIQADAVHIGVNPLYCWDLAFSNKKHTTQSTAEQPSAVSQ